MLLYVKVMPVPILKIACNECRLQTGVREIVRELLAKSPNLLGSLKRIWASLEYHRSIFWGMGRG